MSPITLIFKLTVTVAAVHCLPFHHMKRSADPYADEVADKLSKLKTLLEKLEVVKITKSNLTKDLKEYSKQTEDKFDEKAVESGEDAVTEDQEKIINMKKFVDTLRPEEIRKLKMLKTLVQEARNVRDEDMFNEGSFAEKEVPESKEKVDIINWKELAKRLENERDDLFLQNKRQEIKPVRIEAETKEGTFGAFRDEIKYAVEKNLLTDVALAMHSGISVEEILSDITGQGNEKTNSDVWTRKNRD